MFPNISHVYQQVVPRQSLTVLIGLSFEENHLLTELCTQAEASAPHLGKALADRISQFSNGLNTGYPMSNADIQLYVQDWFLQLFQNEGDAYLRFPKTFRRVPLNVLLTGIDVILSYGHQVTQSSSNPEAATQAFHKVLALKITCEQLRSQSKEEQHLYEIMLLD